MVKNKDMEELKDGWRRVKLENLGEIVSGGTPKTSMKEYWNGKVAWLTPKDFSNQKNKYWKKGERSITDEGLKNSSAKLMPKGTVLFTSRAPIGYVGIADREVSTNQGFKNIIANKENSNEFIYYLLKYITPNIESIAGGSTFKEISASAFKNIEVEVPNLETQEKIASILSALDDKIELNNEMNKTLEEMAQTLFKRWFIDFDFPNENGEPYRSSGGKMVDSELGEIPEGWKIGSLEEIVDNFDTKRKPLSKKERDTKEKKYPYYGAAGIIDYVDNYLFNGEYILLGEDGTVITNEGTPILNFINEKFWVSNHAHVIKAKEKFNNDFVHYLLRNTNVSHIVTGAVQPKINQKNLNGLKILIPKIKEISEFGILVSNFTKMLRNNNSEINSLTQIRDALLPKLMSGEIEV